MPALGTPAASAPTSLRLGLYLSIFVALHARREVQQRPARRELNGLVGGELLHAAHDGGDVALALQGGEVALKLARANSRAMLSLVLENQTRKEGTATFLIAPHLLKCQRPIHNLGLPVLPIGKTLEHSFQGKVMRHELRQQCLSKPASRFFPEPPAAWAPNATPVAAPKGAVAGLGGTASLASQVEQRLYFHLAHRSLVILAPSVQAHLSHFPDTPFECLSDQCMPRRAHEAPERGEGRDGRGTKRTPATPCPEYAQGRPRTAECSGSRCTKTAESCKWARVKISGLKRGSANTLTKQANEAVQSIFAARKSMESHLFLL
jgi:hypothetical protein